MEIPKKLAKTAIKTERLTNQANYLLTVATTGIAGVVTAALGTGVVNQTLLIPLAGIWIMCFSCRLIEQVVRASIERANGLRQEQSSTDSE